MESGIRDVRVDLVGREAAALRQLERLVAQRSESESTIEREYNTRREALDLSLLEARRASSARLERETADAERMRLETPARLRAEFESNQAELDKTYKASRSELTRRFNAELDAAKKALSETRWEAGTICEAGLNAAKHQTDQIAKAIAAVEHRLDSIQESATDLLRRRRLKSLTSDLESGPADTEIENPTSDDLHKALQEAETLHIALQRLALSRLLAGIAPLSLVLLVSALLGTLGYLASRNLQAAVAGAGGGVILGLLLIMIVFLAAKGQARKIVGQLARAISTTRSLASIARRKATDEYDRKQRDLLEKRDAEHARADEKARKTLGHLRHRYEREIGELDARRKAELEAATQARDLKILQVEEEASRALVQARHRFEQEQAETSRRYEQNRAETDCLRDQALQDMANAWRSGMIQIQQEFGFVSSEISLACPDWAARDWIREPAAAVVPPAIRFGELSVDLGMFPGGPPKDPSLQEGLESSFVLPALLRCPEGCSLVIKTAAEGRDQAIGTLQATMLRLLSSLPPGKVRFTIFDPVGLGQNFAAFMHLADFDEQLVSSRIWTESQHIEQRLTDLTEHMENVIQKYLRNEYGSIMEYNAKAGEVAEPFRFLVVADFPARFNETSARRLLSVAASGARCGVFTLVSVDSRLDLPQGFHLRDLEKHANVLSWKDGKLRWNDPLFGGFPLRLDPPPPPDLFTSLVQAVGKKAHGASRVEVPFEFVAPPDGQLWILDSRNGIDVPLGRAGATKTQNLRLGQGTSQHALIAGKTGSGKSTLLHILITNTALYYSPDEVELYLLDFKKGVEFKTYATHQLPHARVIAVESEREFGLSVLQRLDAELKDRGDRFRAAGAQDVAAFRSARPNERMPRILLIVDEFQEFFVEDDKIGQEAALLLDRLVRQGRAFGIHVHLGSQTLAGAYTLARATLGQMAVRIALQSSEADASLILSDDNTAARLLTRPGEAIYNDANGRIEGNNFFQVVWLGDDKRDHYLQRIHQEAVHRGFPQRPQVVFEGNVPPDPSQNAPLAQWLDAPNWPLPPPKVDSVWLGEPVAIKEPTAVVFRRQGGSHLLAVGQDAQLAAGLITMALISLAAHRPDVRFAVLDGTPPDSPEAGLIERTTRRLPQGPRVFGPPHAARLIEELAEELHRRQESGRTDASPLFLIIHDLQRFRDLRKAEDDYGFSSRSADLPVPPSERLATILREGPLYGLHALIWCDSLNNLNRTFDRGVLRELETRVLFQMSAGDSSTLIDNPAANRLGPRRALLANEVQGQLEKFRPYPPPSGPWLDRVASALSRRSASRPSDAS